MPFESISALSRSPDLLREWCRAGLFALALVVAVGEAAAQAAPDSPAPAPAATATAQVVISASNAPVSAAVTNVPASTNAAPAKLPLASTNLTAAASPAPKAPVPAAKPAAPVSPTSYEAFKLIADRNIFNPNRYPQRARSTEAPPPPKPQPKVESFALVGTISYEQGAFAFFDSNNSQYRKTLKPGDTIANYKLTDVAANAVKLETEGKELELKVGMQMRREDEGAWQASVRTDSVASSGAPGVESSSRGSSSSSRGGDRAEASPTAASPATGGDSGGASELLKRLMEQRKKELNP